MKMPKLVAVLFVLLAPVLAWAQSPALAAARSRILTEDDFRAFLLTTTWTWMRQDGPTDEKIRFLDDGTAHHSSFVAKFSIRNTHTVDLLFNRQTARLIFDPTYKHYLGTDFDGARAVQGERVDPSQDAASNLGTPPPTDVTKGILTANTWVFDAPHPHYHAYRTFNKDGTWKTEGDSLHGTWKIEGGNLLITLTILPNAPETYPLPLRKIGWCGAGALHDPVSLDVADHPPQAGATATPASEAPAYFGTSRQQ